jgi:hypothetical protein
MNGENIEWAAEPDSLTRDPADLTFLNVEDLPIHKKLQELGGRGVPSPQFALHLQARLMQEVGALSGNERTTAVTTETLAIPGNQAGRRRSWSRRLQARLSMGVAAVLLAASGLVAFQHTGSPAPVSAKTVLAHVAAALPSTAGEVFHQIQVTQDLGIGGNPPTARDSWTELDASGAVIRQAVSESTVSGVLLDRFVQDGSELHSYDAVYNVVTNRPLEPGDAQSLEQDPYGVAEMRQLVEDARQGIPSGTTLLPQQTLDGTMVDVVKVIPTVPKAKGGGVLKQGAYSLLYIDPNTYAIRGVDTFQVDAQGVAQPGSSMRVTLNVGLSPVDVPANAFAFAPPAAATVAAQPPACVIPTILQPITVAQALAVPDAPALLLAGDPAGLKLQQLKSMNVPQTTTNGLKGVTVDSQYATASGAGTFEVTVFTGGPSGPAASAAQSRPTAHLITRRNPDGTTSTTEVRTINLTIGGQLVSAAYDATTTGASSNRDLNYQASGITVNISGEQLSEAAFLEAVNALVDGKTDPAVAQALQGELNLAPPVPATPTPKPYCGGGVG